MKIRLSHTKNKSIYTKISRKEMIMAIELSKRKRIEKQTSRKVPIISTKSTGQGPFKNLIQMPMREKVQLASWKTKRADKMMWTQSRSPSSITKQIRCLCDPWLWQWCSSSSPMLSIFRPGQLSPAICHTSPLPSMTFPMETTSVSGTRGFRSFMRSGPSLGQSWEHF